MLCHRTKRGGNRSAFTGLQYLQSSCRCLLNTGKCAMRDKGKMMEKRREGGDMGGTA